MESAARTPPSAHGSESPPTTARRAWGRMGGTRPAALQSRSVQVAGRADQAWAPPEDRAAPGLRPVRVIAKPGHRLASSIILAWQ